MASTSKQAADEQTKEFTVAPGRTVTLESTNFGPDSKITLPETEGARLQRLGFLRDDDGAVAVPTDGPATETGAEIKES